MKLESFSAILSDCTSKYNKIKKEDYLSEGQFPIIDQGKKFVGGYTDDGNLITDIEKELIIFGDHTKILKFIDFPIAIGADGVKVLHINKEKADPQYIYYFLKSVKLTDAGYSRHFKFLKEIKIPLPETIDDQIKIARLLNYVETLIAQRKESIWLLDELLRSSFLEMFGDPVRNEKGWDKDKVENYTSCIVPGRDKPKSFTGNIPWIRTEDLINKSFFENSKEHIGLSNNEILKVKGKIIPIGSVIMTCVGQLNIISINKKECIINQQLHSFQVNNQLNNIFLMYSLSFQEKFMYKNASTTTVAYMNKTICNSIPIIIPPIDLQNLFATMVEKVETIKENYQASLKELENMFGALSQNSFSLDLDEVKKKSEEVMEQDNLEQYSKSIDLKKEKVDVTNMSFDEYYEIPGEITFKNEKWITYFLHDDLLYQFLLKDNFKDISFTLGDIEMQLHNFFYHTCDMDFDNEKWKEIIFKFLEANPPLIEQYFDKESATIKLKLTDEAFKA
jgi:type I restriction enzyme S subunit